MYSQSCFDISQFWRDINKYVSAWQDAILIYVVKSNCHIYFGFVENTRELYSHCLIGRAKSPGDDWQTPEYIIFFECLLIFWWMKPQLLLYTWWDSAQHSDALGYIHSACRKKKDVDLIASFPVYGLIAGQQWHHIHMQGEKKHFPAVLSAFTRKIAQDFAAYMPPSNKGKGY